MTPLNYQARFEARWGQLHNPHVRALAWLLDAPDLLDPLAAAWSGRLAAPIVVTTARRHWLLALDADPAPLLAALGERNWTRLGLYAEQLMAFFYQSEGRLLAHGLQVRASRNDTIGEFDFLLAGAGGGVEHVELATKFYLQLDQTAGGADFDTLIGPNLADSLGAKMRKIIVQQLNLGAHPAAQALLPGPLVGAHALVKGWLFYPHPGGKVETMAGIAAGHCAGFWCTLDELAMLPAACWVVLPRLQWLAPYRLAQRLDEGTATTDVAGLAQLVRAAFARKPIPVMVAALAPTAAGDLVETSRGFIVPDDWRSRALGR